jgi:hypothetical protein
VKFALCSSPVSYGVCAECAMFSAKKKKSTKSVLEQTRPKWNVAKPELGPIVIHIRVASRKKCLHSEN